MREFKHIYIGGAMTLIAAVTCAVGFSSVQSPEAEAAPAGVSALGAQLSTLHTLGNSVPALRDYAITADMITWTGASRSTAKNDYRQFQCLSEAIYYEARSETLAGQKAVAEVILNRVKSKHFPNTVCGVVYQGAERRTGCQFSFTCDGSLKKTPHNKYWDRSERVAKLALTKSYSAVTKRATHYHTTAVNPPWSQTLKKTDQYGTHVFYRFKNRREIRESQAATAINLAPPPI